ncbi:hypothetical protein GCM10009583_27450 [Ornithinicoccus hortensis]
MPAGYVSTPPSLGPNSIEAVRVSGDDRYDTAARIAENWGGAAPTVFLASGADYPDAMAAAASAGLSSAPVLLTKPNELPDATHMALSNIQPQVIILVGGTSSVSEEVEHELDGLAGKVQRVSGKNRYGTAAELAIRQSSGSNKIFLASGQDYADALAAAALAAHEGAPLLLTKQTHLPAATKAALDELEGHQLVVVGGTSAVTNAVAKQAAAHTKSGTHTRLAGSDRYGTAAAVAQEFKDAGTESFVASGVAFPDALVGAAWSSKQGSPVVLTPPDRVADGTEEALLQQDPSKIYVLGGPASVTDLTVQELVEIVDAPPAATPPGELPGWGAPAWQDEFEGTQVDTAKWYVRDQTYLSYDYGYIVDDAVSVADGKLRIRVDELDTPIVKGDRTRHWSTGYLDSIGLHEADYGRWEIRAKIPTTEGNSRGVWPAFWLRNVGNVGEIDVLEAWGDPPIQHDNPNLTETSRFTLHESTNGGMRTKGWYYEHQLWPGQAPYDTASTGYHTWAVEYTPDYLKAYLDGQLAAHVVPDGELISGTSADYSWVWGPTFVNEPWAMRLNVQMGDDYSTPGLQPNPYSEVPADFLVDYVRFWDYTSGVDGN